LFFLKSFKGKSQLFHGNVLCKIFYQIVDTPNTCSSSSE